VLALGALLFAQIVAAADWPFAVSVSGADRNLAFLWIPPRCEHVRGLIVGAQIHAQVMEDEAIRSVATRQNLALVWLGAGTLELNDREKFQARLQDILARLAAVSGYEEIPRAPVVSLGQSTGCIFAWHFGYWNPARCIAIAALHGAPIHPPGLPSGNPTVPRERPNADGIPTLVVSGQYESCQNSLARLSHG
jgi:predicted esterase